MELLADSLEHVLDTGGSRVYAVTGEITAERLARILPLDACVSADRQEELMTQAVGESGGDTRGSLLLAHANLLRKHGRLDAADAIVGHVEEHYADAHSVLFDIAPTRAELERAARQRVG
jgi:hypothetical protein